MRQKQSLESSPPIQYFPLRSCHVSWATSTLISTSSGRLLTTSPTATSSLLFGLATYGFLGGSDALFFGVNFCGFDDGIGRGGGRPHVGYEGLRVPKTERERKCETPDTSEGVGETVRLVWPLRRGCGWDGSSGFLP